MSSPLYKSLSEKTVLVTGAAHGLGRAVAESFLELGATLVAVDRDTDSLSDLQRSHAGGKVLIVPADLSDPLFAKSLLTILHGQSVDVDILVNNAGIGQDQIRADFITNPVDLWDVDLEIWQRIFSVNVTASYLLMKVLVRGMLRRQWGRIINVTTSLDTMTRRGYAPYGPSKAAMEAMTAIIAKDLDGTGVTANVVVPGGPADTRMVPDASVASRENLISPSVMSAPMMWLASDQGAETSGKRFVAAKWCANGEKPIDFAKAAASAGWPLSEGQTIWPGSDTKV